MSRTLTAADRRLLVRLASAMEKGSSERKAILAVLQKVSMEHATDEAREQYLKDHPNADPKNHTVKDSGKGKGKEEGDAAWKSVPAPTDYSDYVNLPSYKKLRDRSSYDFYSDQMEDNATEIIRALTQKKREGKPESMAMLVEAIDKNTKKYEHMPKHPLKKVMEEWKAQLIEEAKKKAGEAREKGKAAADRSALIRLASALPTGSEERRAILAGLSNKTASSTNWADLFWDARQRFLREVAFSAERELLAMYRNDIKDSKVEGRTTMIKLHKQPMSWHEFRWNFDGDSEVNQMVLIYAAPGVGSGSSQIIKNLNPWQEASGVADEGLRGWKRRGFRDLNGNPIIL